MADQQDGQCKIVFFFAQSTPSAKLCARFSYIHLRFSCAFPGRQPFELNTNLYKMLSLEYT